MKKAVVVGSLNHDLNVKVPRFPYPGETLFATDLSYEIGGKGLNQAIALARMGSDVSFIGAVGLDSFATKIKDLFLQENINHDGIKVVESQVSGTALVIVDDAANNSIIVVPGANMEIKNQDIDDHLDLIAAADYCVMQCEIPMEAIKYTIQKCHELGTKVVLNPAPFHPGLKELNLSMIDYLIPNEIELNQLIENEDASQSLEKKVQLLKDRGAKNIIVTLGEKGSYYQDEDGDEAYISGHKVDAIDTTAAGDSFIGSFVAALCEGKTILESVNFATTVSAITVTRPGAHTSIPTFLELNDIKEASDDK